jgi:hypothetical protein
MLSDDHLLVSWAGTATLKDGARVPLELDITVGALRKYQADPNPCQCDDCREMFSQAAMILELQEAFDAGKVTKKQVVRKLNQMGYRREGRVQHH